MKDFRRPSGQSAGRNGGFERREQSGDFRGPRPEGNRGGYNKYSAQRDSGERREMLHKATCSECNNTCEVPFRPNGSKPVYCKDCFGKKKGAYPSNNMPKNDFVQRAPSMREERSEQPQAPRTEARDPRIEELKAQVFSMQAKLDRILKAMESGKAPEHKPAEKPVFVPKPVEKKAVVPAASAAPVKKEVKKETKKAPVAVKKPVAKAAPKTATKAKPVTKKKK